jgi:hypothetical protein
MNEIAKLVAFADAHPDADAHGFFWCSAPNEFRCVVLLRVPGRSPNASAAAEFFGASAEDLVASAVLNGFEIGPPELVDRLCRTAPLSKIRRRMAKVSP